MLDLNSIQTMTKAELIEVVIDQNEQIELLENELKIIKGSKKTARKTRKEFKEFLIEKLSCGSLALEIHYLTQIQLGKITEENPLHGIELGDEPWKDEALTALIRSTALAGSMSKALERSSKKKESKIPEIENNLNLEKSEIIDLKVEEKIEN